MDILLTISATTSATNAQNLFSMTPSLSYVRPILHTFFLLIFFSLKFTAFTNPGPFSADIFLSARAMVKSVFCRSCATSLHALNPTRHKTAGQRIKKERWQCIHATTTSLGCRLFSACWPVCCNTTEQLCPYLPSHRKRRAEDSRST